MRPQDKKALKKIYELVSEAYSLMSELCDNHQEWMDEREEANDNWPNTPTGETASDDQYNFEEWRDSLEDMETNMGENF